MPSLSPKDRVFLCQFTVAEPPSLPDAASALVVRGDSPRFSSISKRKHAPTFPVGGKQACS